MKRFALAALLREAEKRGVHRDRLLAGLDSNALEMLNARRGRVSWDLFRHVMSNAGEIWSDAELFEIGSQFSRSRFSTRIAFISRLFFDPLDLYYWSSSSRRLGLHPFFHALRDEVRELGDHELEITTRVLEGYRRCPELEHILHGVRTALPQLVGLPRANVEMTTIADGARYTIELPRRTRPALLRRLFAGPFLARETTIALRQAFKELNAQNQRLDERNRILAAEIVERRRAESALRSSELRFAAIGESAHDLIIEVDHRGRCIYASPNYIDHLGFAPEEIGERLSVDWVHPDDIAQLTESVRHMDQTHGQFRSVFRYRHADGHWVWFDTVGKRYPGPDGKARLISLSRDISERVEQEEQARLEKQRESDARLRDLEGKLALETQIADLSRLFLDLETEEIEDTLRNSLASVAELAEAERAYLFTMDRGRTQVEHVFEWFAPEIDSRDWIEKRVEEVKNHGVTDPSPTGWALRKLLKGETVHLPSVSDLPPGEDGSKESMRRRGTRSVLCIPLLSGRDFMGFLGFETVTHERKWSEDDIVLLGLVGQIFMSALRRKRTEDALHESQRQLIHSQKMDALGRLAGGIAHDFNNMLMVIGGCAELLLQNEGLSTDARSDLAEIDEATRRAASLTQQLLAFSRRQPYLPTRLDLNEVVESLRSMLIRVIGEDIELTTDCAPGLETIASDPGQLEQLIVNLAVNARDAMPAGGRLTITTSNRELSKEQARELGLRAAGDHVVLEVQDTGVGIDESIVANIFEPFFTTKQVGRGTGLGLAIVYGIVQQNDAAIQVESKVGRGSTFRVWFPTAPEQSASETRPALPSETDGNETILLVEDEDALRRLVGRVLRQHGYRVLDAENGQRGLEVAAAHDGTLHLVLSDLVMPAMGGLEMARILREERPEIGVLLMSGYADDRVANSTSEIPEAKMLQKPFSMDEMLQEVRGLLAGGDAAARE